MQEIILSDNVKPALEWVNNRVLQKVTPRRRHALAQARFCGALDAWARFNKSGMAGTEWHFQVQPPGEIARTLVPDVAYLSFERMPKSELEATEIARIAPDVVVEVRSPEDLQVDIDEKTRVYLKAGTRVVFLVDPKRRTITALGADGVTKRFVETDTVDYPALPGLAFPARELFEVL